MRSPGCLHPRLIVTLVLAGCFALQPAHSDVMLPPLPVPEAADPSPFLLRQTDVRTVVSGPVALPEPSPDTEPPPPTEPPPDLDLSPVHPAGPVAEPAQPKTTSDGPADDLLSQAMGDPAVQTMLEVFPAEIKDIEEI